MKTITEFPAVTLKNFAKTKQDLITAGKTPEELPAAMGEALKLEGDKLNFVLNALEVVGPRADDLKRVIVYSLNEGEAASGKAQQKGEHYYAVEYFPALNPRGGRDRQDGRGHGRDDRRGGRGGRDKGRGDKKRGRGNDRGPRAGAEGEKSAGGRPERGPRPERSQQPRPPREPRAPRNPLPEGAPKPPPVILASRLQNASATPADVAPQAAETPKAES